MPSPLFSAQRKLFLSEARYQAYLAQPGLFFEETVRLRCPVRAGVTQTEQTMKSPKGKLEQLSTEQIDTITRTAEKKRNVPLVRSRQVNMRLDSEHLERTKRLAAAEGVPYTSFLARLIREDIDRLWRVFQKSESENKDVA